MKVVKLGGSVIAPKENPLSADLSAVIRLSNEIRKFVKLSKEKLVIIHGGGSFGHFLVRECLSNKGLIDIPCYCRTAYYMTELNDFVISSLLSCNLPAVSVSPRSLCFVNRSQGIKCWFEAVEALLNKGVIPVLFGDVVPSNTGFTVISGDSLAWMITKKFKANTLIFVTDVDGLYDRDPRENKDAVLIHEARASEVISKVSGSRNSLSVTGDMLNKLMEGLNMRVRGVKVIITNGKKPGNLYMSLQGKVKGSIIWF